MLRCMLKEGRVQLHVDGAVEDAGPLVGVEGGVVVVADPHHRPQVVADLRSSASGHGTAFVQPRRALAWHADDS